MRSTVKLVVAVVLVVGSFAGLLAPGPAGAQDADPRIPTSLEGGSFVLSLPTKGKGLGATTFPARLLTASVRLHGPVSGPNNNEGGRLITFTSGGLPVCTALTSGGDNMFDLDNMGLARCSVDVRTPGGLMALLTLSVTATFAGDQVWAPSSVKLAPIGNDVQPACWMYCS